MIEKPFEKFLIAKKKYLIAKKFLIAEEKYLIANGWEKHRISTPTLSIRWSAPNHFTDELKRSATGMYLLPQYEAVMTQRNYDMERF